jgi:hypothetical protein
MRRLLYGLAAVLACGVWLPTVHAQPGFFSSAAIREFQQALTDASRFGVPRYATASLPTCDTANTGALALDTTDGVLKVCVSAAWATVGGATVGGDNTWTGTQTFRDNKFLITDDGDTTKILAFQVSGVTAGNTRTLTIPDSSGTLALLGLAQTWTADQTFNDDVDLLLGTGADANLVYNATQTPDAAFFGVGTDSRGLVIAEKADAGFDFAHAQQTNPTLFIHSANQSTTQFLRATHDGTNGILGVGTGLLSVVNDSATFVGIPGVVVAATSTGTSSGYGINTTGTGGSATIQFGINGTRKVSFGFLDATTLGTSAFFLFNGTLNDYQLILQDNSRNVIVGNCVTCASPTGGVVLGPGGSGTNVAGGHMTVAGGRGTGTAAGGNVLLQSSPSIASGTTAQTLETRQLIVAKQFGLTDNTIATFAVQTLGNDTGGGGTIQYCVYAADATTAGLECGSADFAGVDVTAGAGGEVCTNPGKIGTPLQALSGSTLTVTFAATTGTDLCNLRVTADTDIATPVELWIKYTVVNSGRTITPQ